MSLENAFDEQDVLDFDRRAREQPTRSASISAEPKLGGRDQRATKPGGRAGRDAR
jgi:NAD-dependent DNA ligase